MSLTTLRAARDPETSHGRPGCPSAAPGHPPRRGRSPPPADGPHPGTARRGVRLAAEPHARRHRLRAAHPAARQARAGRAGTGSRALLLRGVARPPPRRRPGTRAGHPVRARSAASTRSPRSSAAGPRRSRPGTASPSRRAGSAARRLRAERRGTVGRPYAFRPERFLHRPPAPTNWSRRAAAPPRPVTAARRARHRRPPWSPWRCGWRARTARSPRRSCASRCAASPPDPAAASSSPACARPDQASEDAWTARHTATRAGPVG